MADDFMRPLKVASKKHDLVGITVYDPKEYDLDDIGIATFEDAESKELVTVDTSDDDARNLFKYNADRYRSNINRLFKKYKVDNIMVATDKPYLPPLLSYFKKRARRF